MNRRLRVEKWHGLGNDYLLVRGSWLEAAGVSDCEALGPLARRLSDRHRGIGADGLIAMLPPASGEADLRMVVVNADGGRAEMCGNGIRCVAAAWKRPDGARPGARLRIDTDAGRREAVLEAAGPDAWSVRVAMGRPRFGPAAVDGDGDRLDAGAVDRAPRTLSIDAGPGEPDDWPAFLVSVGNPHAVVLVDRPIEAIDLRRIGPLIERHPAFPRRINLQVARIRGRDEIEMRSWERGAGATLACGTGAAAVHAVAVTSGRVDRRTVVHLPGGDLEMDWPSDDEPVAMTGPAELVAECEAVLSP